MTGKGIDIDLLAVEANGRLWLARADTDEVEETLLPSFTHRPWAKAHLQILAYLILGVDQPVQAGEYAGLTLSIPPTPAHLPLAFEPA